MDEKERLAQALAALGGAHAEDLVNLPECESILKAMKDDGMNSGTAALIVRLAHPKLFEDYATMDGRKFATAEDTLRESTRKRDRVTKTPYADLDASCLSEYELQQLELSMTGRSSCVDTGALEKARARQRGGAK